MTVPPGDGPPFDLGGYAGRPSVLTASEVLDVPMRLD